MCTAAEWVRENDGETRGDTDEKAGVKAAFDYLHIYDWDELIAVLE